MDLGVFVKHWSSGQSKTRLAAGVGASAAVRIARAMAKTSIDRFAAVQASRWLLIPDESSRRVFERIAKGRFAVDLQGAGGLGDRLERWFERRFAAGAAGAVAVGADAPSLPLRYLEAAFDELERHSAVVGPAQDGGYYLLGLRAPVLPVFEGIDWGTATVLCETLDRLRRLGVSFSVLPEWYDVDTGADLDRLRSDLAKNCEDAACQRLLRSIVRVCDRR